MSNYHAPTKSLVSEALVWARNMVFTIFSLTIGRQKAVPTYATFTYVHTIKSKSKLYGDNDIVISLPTPLNKTLSTSYNSYVPSNTNMFRFQLNLNVDTHLFEWLANSPKRFTSCILNKLNDGNIRISNNCICIINNLT